MTTAPDVRIIDSTDPGAADRPFLPGMSKTWLTPLYDAMARAMGMRRRYARVAELAGVRAGESVIDVGCGTGNLLRAILDAAPEARVTGLDPDPEMLRITARKLLRDRRRGTLVRGFADRLPAEDGTVDHVVSSMALHHIPEGDRPAFAREIARVLRPGGRVTILDIGGGPMPDDAAGHGTPGGGHHPHGGDAPRHGAPGGGAGHHHHGGHEHAGSQGSLAHLWNHLTAPLRRRTHDNPHTAASQGDGIPRLLADAGLADAREIAHEDWSMGRLTYVQATAR